MSKYTIVLYMLGVFVIGILLSFNRGYKSKLEVANKQVNSLEAQIASVLEEHHDLAELYLNISNRVRNVRFDTLQDTLRLEEVVHNSEPESDLRKWSNQTLPTEVKEVMSNMGRKYDTGVKDIQGTRQ